MPNCAMSQRSKEEAGRWKVRQVLRGGLSEMTDVRRRSFLVSIAAWMTGLFVRQAIPMVLPPGLCQADGLSSASPRRSSNEKTDPDVRTLDDHLSMVNSYWFTDVASRVFLTTPTTWRFAGQAELCSGSSIPPQIGS